MSPPAARAGALVIGGDYQGLATARSLGRRGIPVAVIDDERSIGRYSRYVHRHVAAEDLREEAATVTALLEAAERDGLAGSVLYPTRDENVAAIARNHEQLSERYVLTTPAWDVVRWAWDKRNTYRLAAELGLPAPRTWTLRGEADLGAVDGEPPFVIKPAIKERFFYVTGAKAWRADSRGELRRRVGEAARLIGLEEVVVQELIPGGGDCQFSYCAFYAAGTARAEMTVQRLRQHPPEFGRASTYVRTVAEERLIAPSRRLLAAIGYSGLVELEYKYDGRTATFKLLDFNPRTWGYHGLAQSAGVDFPYLAYAEAAGLPRPDPGRSRPGVGWVRLATDLPTAALEILHGRMSPRAYLGSLRHVDVGGVWSLEDPLPGLAELALLPYAALKRGL